MDLINFAYGIIPLNSVMKLKTYHLLDCDSQEQISREALAWISEHTDLLTNATGFWNKIDYKHFILLNPALSKYCQKLKLIIREVAVLVADSNDGVPLHIDEAPVVAKINFPVLNTKDTYTEWYDVKNLNQLPTINNQFDQPIPDLTNAVTEKINQVEMTQPMVFNSSVAHRVVIGPKAELPRVVISCMFYKEPIDLLKTD